MDRQQWIARQTGKQRQDVVAKAIYMNQWMNDRASTQEAGPRDEQLHLLLSLDFAP